MGLLDGAGAQAGTAAVQQALAALPGIEKFTDDERNALVQSMAALLQQASAVVQADLKPLVDQSAAWYAMVAHYAGMLTTTGIEGTIGGIPFTLRAVQPKT